MKGKKSTTYKGRLFETIAASMYDKPDVKVEQNVYLDARCKGDKKRRKREIDILITGQLAGQPIRIAVECKDRSKKIESPDIDAYIGKLNDVGIPIGIYISANGYTSDAIEYAREKGIATLILKDASQDAITASIKNAVKSLIYLLLIVKSIELVNDYDRPMDGSAAVLYNLENFKCVTIPDLVWRDWKANRIPSELGSYHIEFEIPCNYKQIYNNKIIKIMSASAEIQVIGLVFTEYGNFKEHILIDAATNQLKQSQIKIKFNDCSGTFPAKVVETETDLEEISHKPNSINLRIGRFRMPKILVNCIYWPPSGRVYATITDQMKEYYSGINQDSKPLNLQEIEGKYLNSIWEPIWQGHSSIEIDSKISSNIIRSTI